MARKKVVNGFCRICGKEGPLSYEHVPPQAAFNKERAIEYRLEDVIYKTESRGRIQQGGIGVHTLCEQCNNDTGAWYGTEYVQWAKIGQNIIHNWKAKGKTEGIVTLKGVYPLRFLKQVITCFFSVVGSPDGAAFARQYPGLVQFVLNRQEQKLPNYHFFLDLYPVATDQNTSLRRYPLAAKITVITDGKGMIKPLEAHVLSEYTHPPFALSMTLDNALFGATDITHFKNYAFDECVDIELALRIVKSTSPYPAA